MKKSKILFGSLFIFLLSVFTFCTKDAPAPVAGFTTNGDGNNAPCDVSFINSSEHANAFSWDFGDGSTSTEKSPKHTYTTSGTFTVSLAATGDGGSNTISKSITIKEPPTGQAIFWCASATLGGSYIDINVSGVYAGRITAYSTSTPECGSSGFVTITKIPGTYSWTATGQDGTKWNSTITITEGTCHKMQLTGKKKSSDMFMPFEQPACD